MSKEMLRNVFFALVITIFIPTTDIAASTLITAPYRVANALKKMPIDGFIKINSGELPGAVIQALIKDFPTSTLRSAFKNSKSQFKLEMVLESGKVMIVYTDAYGNWLKL
ncbi:hypothetical protein K8352_05630 [Flavobacteriaceae bacterium F89]|uniref:Uncharacterized protein n=1 Tax=Cerina litoralis TaxID=2874477 RepID=A0AAE3ESF1_9FLAO|nr:hypothetical protein [Cerina litoralis]MCG2460220.1 hypothetical protein [Cerina litoralis]